MKFYNRVSELKHLENIYSHLDIKFQLCVLFGRRRIGKTELIKRFLENKNGLYYFVESKNIKIILNEFEEHFNKLLGFTPRINNFDDLFDLLKQEFKNKKFVVVLDEFQNFKSVDSSIFSTFQKKIDELQNTQIMMICIGSYVGLMKKLFVSKKEPLFGRSDYIMHLKPFNYFECNDIYNDLKICNINDKVALFGILDGIPKYLNYLFLYNKNLKNIINKLFIDTYAPLFEEGRNILIQEFGSEHKGYFSILEAVALGYNTPEKIKDFSGLNNNTISKYLIELKEYYELIERIIPVTKKINTKNSRYRISDNFYKFWFRYIYKNYAALQFSPNEILENIMKDLPAYCGEIFETVCIEYLLNDFVPNNKIIISEYGKWWSNNIDDEIDLVILDKKNTKVVFAECKFRNKMIKLNMVKEFHNRVQKFNWYNTKRKEYLLYFSKSKFEKSAVDYCEENKIVMKLF